MRPALLGGDEPHYALMAHSIAVDHDLDLRNDYAAVDAGSNAAGRKFAGRTLDPHLRHYGDRIVFSHPLGLPALVSPAVWLLDRLAPGAAPDLLLGGITLALTFAAFLGGWWLLLQVLDDRRAATLVAFAIYFSTPLWFYSRTFFTEPYTWAFAVLAVVALARDRWITASILLALVFLVKETGILIVLPILVFTAYHRGVRRAAELSIGPAVAVAIFATKNLLVYGSPLVTFQPFEPGNPLRGLLGETFDLRHGILPFAPLLLIAAAGWFMNGRREEISRYLPFAASVALSYFVLISIWTDWGGGSCYGPRLFVPAIPAFSISLACVERPGRRRTVARLLLDAAIVAGFAIQCAAATNPFAAFWSASVIEIVYGNPAGAIAGAVVAAAGLHLLERREPAPPRIVPESD